MDVNKKILIKKLEILLEEATKMNELPTALVITTLLGSLHESTDREFAKHCGIFVRQKIENFKAKFN